VGRDGSDGNGPSRSKPGAKTPPAVSSDAWDQSAPEGGTGIKPGTCKDDLPTPRAGRTGKEAPQAEMPAGQVRENSELSRATKASVTLQNNLSHPQTMLQAKVKGEPRKKKEKNKRLVNFEAVQRIDRRGNT